MSSAQPNPGGSSAVTACFPSTHWSIVLSAGDDAAADAGEAMAQLCRKYWRPLYYFVRRHGHGPDDAQDLTQGFLAHLLASHAVDKADPHRGRFRSFLLASLRHYLSDQWDRATAAKRGGGRPPLSIEAAEAEQRYQAELADPITPERLYERQWAMTLLEGVLQQLQREYEVAGKAAQYEALKRFLWGPDACITYAQVAASLGLTESGVKTLVRRLRGRYRHLLRCEIAHTVGAPGEVEEEIRWLLEIFG